jgi:hypothetical protein
LDNSCLPAGRGIYLEFGYWNLQLFSFSFLTLLLFKYVIRFLPCGFFMDDSA